MPGMYLPAQTTEDNGSRGVTVFGATLESKRRDVTGQRTRVRGEDNFVALKPILGIAGWRDPPSTLPPPQGDRLK